MNPSVPSNWISPASIWAINSSKAPDSLTASIEPNAASFSAIAEASTICWLPCSKSIVITAFLSLFLSADKDSYTIFLTGPGSGTDTASENGLIQRAADVGGEAGAMTIDQEGESQALSLSGTIIDVTLRDPMLSMAFGSPLEGDCADDWNNYAAADSDLDAEEIRKEVIKCSDAVADANQTDSYTWILDFVLAFPTATGVIGLLAVFSIFLLWQVYLAMYNAVLTIIQSFIALYPGNARTTWLASLFSVLASIILIGAYVFAVTIYVWVMGAVMDIVPAPLARLGSILLGIIIVIAAYNFWKMKKSGKNISQALAERFAKNSLSKDSTPRKPSY